MNTPQSSQSVQIETPPEHMGIIIGGPLVIEKRITNAILTGVPIVGSMYAAIHFYQHGVGITEVICFFIFYLMTGIGIGLGFHRYLTHRSFVPVRWLKLLLLFLGSIAFQGSAIRWVADHRRHHRLADKLCDTHSPHFTEKAPAVSVLKGLWHSHFAWMFDRTSTDERVYVPDLLSDNDCILFQRYYWLCTALSLLLPYLFGLEFGGANVGFRCLLLGGFVRTFALHNFIWAVNSVGHSFGRQDASTRDNSRNSLLLALATFGEGWHNNHHAAPRSAWNQWKWYQVDFNGWLIVVLEKCKLISDVVYVDTLIHEQKI